MSTPLRTVDWRPIKLFALAFGGYACGSAANAVVGALDGGAPQEAAAQGEDAAAPDAGPSVYTETCSHSFTYGGGAEVYAEHSYPGLSSSLLTSVRVTAHLTANAAVPVGYDQQSAGIDVLVRDGYVAALCGSQTAPGFDTVTFIGP